MALVLKEHTDHVAEGRGVSFDVLYLNSWLGEIEITICDTCEFMRILCCHSKNTWQGPKGTESLICDLCGADGI